MKAIINGKRYDTEKSTFIGAAGSGGSSSDFRYWEANLYKTPRSGSYFLAGMGNGMTAFAHVCSDGSRGWGEKILPLTDGDALEWAEQNLDAAKVEAHFSDQIEDA